MAVKTKAVEEVAEVNSNAESESAEISKMQEILKETIAVRDEIDSKLKRFDSHYQHILTVLETVKNCKESIADATKALDAGLNTIQIAEGKASASQGKAEELAKRIDAQSAELAKAEAKIEKAIKNADTVSKHFDGQIDQIKTGLHELNGIKDTAKEISGTIPSMKAMQDVKLKVMEAYKNTVQSEANAKATGKAIEKTLKTFITDTENASSDVEQILESVKRVEASITSKIEVIKNPADMSGDIIALQKRIDAMEAKAAPVKAASVIEKAPTKEKCTKASGVAKIDATGRCFIYLDKDFVESVLANAGDYEISLSGENVTVSDKATKYFCVTGEKSTRFEWEATV